MKTITTNCVQFEGDRNIIQNYLALFKTRNFYSCDWLNMQNYIRCNVYKWRLIVVNILNETWRDYFHLFSTIRHDLLDI